MKDELADYPPEHEVEPKDESGLTMQKAALSDDIGAQPDPEDPNITRHTQPRSWPRDVSLSDVQWPSEDKEAPDYAFLAELPETPVFELTADTLETLFQTGRYKPHRTSRVIAFALRGATISASHQIEEAQSISLETTRPDHRTFCCVIGFYFPDTKRITAYTGSTVPCRAAIAGYANGGSAANMLPTGLHTFYVWRHRSLHPALRLGSSSADPETGARATVLRSTNNVILESLDIFDLSRPLDNVHCSYYLSEQAHLGAMFSSWGCLTVRGLKDPSDQWARFQIVLNQIGAKKRVDLLLTTGKEAAVAAASGHSANLTALRTGSRGPEVQRLQRHLGLAETGYLGARTLDRMTGAERSYNSAAGNGRRATGIYTPALDARTGWGVFS